MSKTIFISGKHIAPASDDTRKFKDWEKKLTTEKDIACHNTHAQAWAKAVSQQPYEEQMRSVITIMLQCNELHLLPDWAEEKESCLLRHIAMNLKMPIIYH